MNAEALGPHRPLHPQPKAIIVGASSGIGAALVKKLVHEGYAVAGLARRREQLEAVCRQADEIAGTARAFPYTHNVTDFDEIPALFQQVVQDLGGLDLIVYVAGIQPPVAPNEYNFEKDAAMTGVNLLGAIAWFNQAAKRFERVNGGHIVGISSISGDRGRSAFPGYHTSKGALSIYLESLRNRLSRKGVTVTTIKPGFVKTALLKNAKNPLWAISPEEAAAKIYEAIKAKKKTTVYVPGRWRWVSLIISNIPSFIFRRMNL